MCYSELDGSGQLGARISDAASTLLSALPFSSLVFTPPVRRAGLFNFGSGGSDDQLYGRFDPAADYGTRGPDPLGAVTRGLGNVLTTVGNVVTAPLTPIAAGARAIFRGVGDASNAVAETVGDFVGLTPARNVRVESSIDPRTGFDSGRLADGSPAPYTYAFNNNSGFATPIPDINTAYSNGFGNGDRNYNTFNNDANAYIYSNSPRNVNTTLYSNTYSSPLMSPTSASEGLAREVRRDMNIAGNAMRDAAGAVADTVREGAREVKNATAETAANIADTIGGRGTFDAISDAAREVKDNVADAARRAGSATERAIDSITTQRTVAAPFINGIPSASNAVKIETGPTNVSVANAVPGGMHSHSYTVHSPRFLTVTETGSGPVAVTRTTAGTVSPTGAVPAASEIMAAGGSLQNELRRQIASPPTVTVKISDNCSTLSAVSDLQYAHAEATTRAKLELDAANAAAGRADADRRARASAQAQAEVLAREHSAAQARAAAEVERRVQAEIAIKTAAAAKAEAERLAATQAARRLEISRESETLRRARDASLQELNGHRSAADGATREAARLRDAHSAAVSAADTHARQREALMADMQRALQQREAAEAAAKAAADRAAADAAQLARLAEEKQGALAGLAQRVEEHELRTAKMQAEIESLGKLEREARAVAARHAGLIAEQQRVRDASMQGEAAARQEERGKGSRLAQLLAILSSKSTSENIARQEADAHRKAYNDAMEASAANAERLRAAAPLDTSVTVMRDVGGLPTVTVYENEPVQVRVSKTTTTTTRTETDSDVRTMREPLATGTTLTNGAAIVQPAQTRVEVLNSSPTGETVRTTTTESAVAAVPAPAQMQTHIYDVRGLDATGIPRGGMMPETMAQQQQRYFVQQQMQPPAMRTTTTTTTSRGRDSSASGSGGGWFSWLFGSGGSSNTAASRTDDVLFPAGTIPDINLTLPDGTPAMTSREIEAFRLSGARDLTAWLADHRRANAARIAAVDAELEHRMGMTPAHNAGAPFHGYTNAQGLPIALGGMPRGASAGGFNVESRNFTTARNWSEAGQMSAIERTRHSACLNHDHHGTSARLRGAGHDLRHDGSADRGDINLADKSGFPFGAENNYYDATILRNANIEARRHAAGDRFSDAGSGVNRALADAAAENEALLGRTLTPGSLGGAVGTNAVSQRSSFAQNFASTNARAPHLVPATTSTYRMEGVTLPSGRFIGQERESFDNGAMATHRHVIDTQAGRPLTPADRTALYVPAQDPQAAAVLRDARMNARERPAEDGRSFRERVVDAAQSVKSAVTGEGATLRPDFDSVSSFGVGPNMWVYRPLHTYLPGSGDVVMLPNGNARYRDGTVLRRDGALIRADGVMVNVDGSVLRNRDGVVITTANFDTDGRGKLSESREKHPNFLLPSFFWMDDEKSVEYLDDFANGNIAEKERNERLQRGLPAPRYRTAAVTGPMSALMSFLRNRSTATSSGASGGSASGAVRVPTVRAATSATSSSDTDGSDAPRTLLGATTSGSDGESSGGRTSGSDSE